MRIKTSSGGWGVRSITWHAAAPGSNLPIPKAFFDLPKNKFEPLLLIYEVDKSIMTRYKINKDFKIHLIKNEQVDTFKQPHSYDFFCTFCPCRIFSPSFNLWLVMSDKIKLCIVHYYFGPFKNFIQTSLKKIFLHEVTLPCHL